MAIDRRGVGQAKEGDKSWWEYPLDVLEWGLTPLSWAGQGAENWTNLLGSYAESGIEGIANLFGRSLYSPETREEQYARLAAGRQWPTEPVGEGQNWATTMLPGGASYEEYRSKPVWEQFVWEAPTLFAPGFTELNAFVKGSGAIPKVARAALKPGVMLETGLQRATSGIAGTIRRAIISKPVASKIGVAEVDPFVTKFKSVLTSAEEATEMTAAARSAEASRRAAEQAKWLKVAKEATTPAEQAEALARASAARAGKMPVTSTPEVEYMKRLRGGAVVDIEDVTRSVLSEDDLFQLRGKILQSDLQPYQQTRLANETLKKFLTTGKALQPSEIAMLKKVIPGFEELIAIKEQVILKGGAKAWKVATEVLNVSRTMLTMGDISAYRQLTTALARFPGEIYNVGEIAWRCAFDPEAYNSMMRVIKESPGFLENMERMGIKFDNVGASAIGVTTRNEFYMGERILETTPGLKQTVGKVVAPSARAFVAPINYMRATMGEYYYNFAQKLIKSSPKLAGQEDVLLKEFGDLVMALTGRGNLPKVLNKASPILNALFFAPRWVMSRLQIPYKIIKPGIPAVVRKEAARDLAQFMGAGALFLGLMKVHGAEIEVDPRSSDLLKVKIGNTRLDVWTGYAQWLRLLSQLATGQKKSTGTGKVAEADRETILYNFFQSKQAPIVSIFLDLIAGQTYIGDPIYEGELQLGAIEVPSWVRTMVFERFVPLFAQDMVDAIETDGMAGALAASPGFFGVGVVSYEAKRGTPSGLPSLPSPSLPSLPSLK